MLSQGVFAAILILVVTFDRNRFATGNTKCIPPAKANLSCNFTSDGDTCGWKVVNNENVTRNWTFDGEGQLTVEMNKTDAENTRARLRSNLMCDTNNSYYFFRFDYSIKSKDQNDLCELMVFHVPNRTKDPIWLNQTGSNHLVSSGDIRIEVQNKFRLIILAKKITNEKEKCTLKLDNIVFRRAAIHPTVPTTPTSVTTSSETLQTIQPTLTPSGSAPTVAATSTDTTKTYTTTPATTTSPATASTSAATDLPPEAFVGIVLGIVAIIAVAIATFLLLRRKPGKETKCCTLYLMHFGTTKQQHSRPTEVDNLAYVGEVDRIPVRTLPSKMSPEAHGLSDHYSVPNDALPLHGKRKDSQPESSDYETAHLRESSHYYSKLRDDDHDDNADFRSKAAGKANGSVPAYELATISHSAADDVDLKGLKKDQKKNTDAPKDGSHANTEGTNADSYNILSFQQPSSAPPSKKTEDTYNHLQGQDPVYKVPRSDANSEYSLATNPDITSDHSAANTGNKHRYVNVDENRKPLAPLAINPPVHATTGTLNSTSGSMQKGVNSDYNHLNMKDGHPVINSNGGPSSDVYNHLDDGQNQKGAQQSDEYNRVDFDRRTAADKTNGTDADATTYNHLDTRQDPAK